MDRAADRRVVFMLRFGAALTGAALLTLPLPVDWMASTHRWLGLGDLPRTPIVEYLARSVSMFYGMHGVLLAMLSTNVQRYAPIITLTAVMTMLFGILLLAIDLHAGMPAYWTIGEGPPVVLIGVVLLVLNRAAVRDRDPAVAARV